MSEKMDNGLDLSRIVGLIMENPGLIAQIADLARKGEPEKDKTANEERKPESIERISRDEPVIADPIVSQKERRSTLLSALKPYVSGRRAQAIDSMITITEMIEMMKAR